MTTPRYRADRGSQGQTATHQAAARRAAARARTTLVQLARVPWLGPEFVAACLLPDPPPCGSLDVRGGGDAQGHVRFWAEACSSPRAPARLAAARLRALGVLVARFGALPDSSLSAEDLAALAAATLDSDRREEVRRAAGALLGAL